MENLLVDDGSANGNGNRKSLARVNYKKNIPHLRMNMKLETIERRLKRGRGGNSDILETLAQV